MVAFALAACLVPWYAGLFADVPALLHRDDLLGNADSGAFGRLLHDFDLARTYGDHRGAIAHDAAANAQKHKIHHVLYAVVGSGLASVARALPGVSARDAVLLVNASIGALNALLVFTLCGRTGAPGGLRLVTMGLYGGALSTIVLSAQPDSWLFTGTLVLGFFVLLQQARIPRGLLAVLVGIAMLNNPLLGLLVAPLVLEAWSWSGRSVRAVVRGAVAAPIIAVGTWIVALCMLSLVEGAFRPDHYLRYLVWFKRFDANFHIAPWHDPKTLARTVAMALFGSVSSAPPNTQFMPTAAASTLRGGGAAAAAMWGVVLLTVVAGARFVGSLRTRRAQGVPVAAILRDPTTLLALHVVLGTAAILLTSWPSAFLYSPLVVGPLLVLLHRQLARGPRAAQAALVVVTALVVAVNVRTVARFAERLRAEPVVRPAPVLPASATATPRT